MTPDGWQSATLGDDATVLSGQHILADECSESRIGLPYLTGPADFQDGIIRATKYVRSPKVVCEAGDILLTVKGSGTGKLVQADATYCISRQLAAIRPQAWWGRFVLHVLSSLQSRLQDSASGLIPGLSRDELLGLPVLLPPIGEQKKIAAILSSVDDAIEATQAVIDQLAVVKKAMMAELLTRGLPGRHKKFKMTEIGEVPEGWSVAPCGDLFEVQLGKMMSQNARAGANQLPYLRNENVYWHRLDLSDVSTMAFDERERSKFRLRKGDLLACEGRHIGRCGVWNDELDECYYQKALHRLRPTCDAVTTGYMKFFMALRFRYQSDLVAEANSTSTIPHLPREKLVALPMWFPPREEQDEIVELLDTLLLRGEANEAVLDRLAVLKSAIMSVLLTGEVRVKPGEEAA